MPSYLDLTLIAVVLISALLSMLRGFTREVMAIASWAAAAAAAYYFYPMGTPFLRPYLPKEQYAQAGAAAVIFFITLVVISFITIKISDAILDSKIGALDRSLGFLFGAGRGYLLCVIAFVFFAWLVPEKSYPDWVKNSRTRSWLEATGVSLQGMMPENLDATISSVLKKQKGGTDDSPADADKTAPEDTGPAAPAPPPRPGGKRTEAQPLRVDAIMARYAAPLSH